MPGRPWIRCSDRVPKKQSEITAKRFFVHCRHSGGYNKPKQKQRHGRKSPMARVFPRRRALFRLFEIFCGIAAAPQGFSQDRTRSCCLSPRPATAGAPLRLSAQGGRAGPCGWESAGCISPKRASPGPFSPICSVSFFCTALGSERSFPHSWPNEFYPMHCRIDK